MISTFYKIYIVKVFFFFRKKIVCNNTDEFVHNLIRISCTGN